MLFHTQTSTHPLDWSRYPHHETPPAHLTTSTPPSPLALVAPTRKRRLDEALDLSPIKQPGREGAGDWQVCPEGAGDWQACPLDLSVKGSLRGESDQPVGVDRDSDTHSADVNSRAFNKSLLQRYGETSII